MSAQERDRNHELLCAWILGEASEAEAREVEQALAASPELRAERERLSRTIGLVQHVYEGEASLSEDAMEQLLAAASASTSRGPRLAPAASSPSGSDRRQAWYRAPGLRAAAAVTALLGGVLGILSIQDDGGGAYRDTVAHAPAEAASPALDRPSAAVLDSESTFEKRKARKAPQGLPAGELAKRELADADLVEDSLGRYKQIAEAEESADLDDSLRSNTVAPDKPAGQDREPGSARSSDAAKKADETAALGQLSSIENRLVETSEADPPVTISERRQQEERSDAVEGLQALRELGYAGSDDGEDLGERVIRDELTLTDGAVSLGEAQRRRGGEVAGNAPPAPKSALPSTGEVDVGGKEGKDVSGASDDFFLGRGRPTGGKTSGDTSGASGGAGGGGAGPASPGPSGPSTPGSPGPPRARAKASEPWDSVPPAEGKNELGGAAPARGAEGEAAAETGRYLRGELSDTGLSDAELEDADELLALAKVLDERDRASTRTFAIEDIPVDGRALRFSRRFTEDELSRLSELLARRQYLDCRRKPSEAPRDMFFRYWGDNPFELVVQDPLSTFSVDVDTASYALARHYLNDGHLPPKAQVRTEEFVNYFPPDLPAPSEGTFAISTELAPSLFGGKADRWMLRVGLRGKEVSALERKPLALTFVIDTSGSMRENGRLELVKHAVRLLVTQLDGRDSIALVAYSNEARVILPMTPASQRGLIESAIHPLTPSGSTNAEAGLKMGYELAQTVLDPQIHNRVVFLSDGVANVGQTDQDRLSTDVAAQRARGIYLNTIGVGMNNHNDVFLEQLANHGDGICDYVDSAKAAERAIVDRFAGAFVPIASDVKIQVEFDSTRVDRYRLLGYENRAVADQDFRNDAVDAGEVGSGHQVIALYELDLAGPLDTEAALATVRVRWKAPKTALQHPLEVDVTEMDHQVIGSLPTASFATASTGYRRSVLVAQLAELLRRSTHAANDSFETLMIESERLAAELSEPDFDEFVALVRTSIRLGLPLEFVRKDELERVLDEYRRHLYLRAQLEEVERLRAAVDEDALRDLRNRNDELENMIRNLIHEDLKHRNR